MTSRICFAHVERPRDNLFQFPLGNREPNLPNPGLRDAIPLGLGDGTDFGFAFML